jgi:two-component system chemotaxis response regulator CheY
MSRKTIMTVDDSRSVRFLVSFTLKQLGYEMIEAENGQEALRKLADTPVDMLITDVNMPELDGIGLVRKVREMPSYKFIPILILTTESQREKRDAGREAGATGWIVKPFSPDKLIEVVRKVMK